MKTAQPRRNALGKTLVDETEQTLHRMDGAERRFCHNSIVVDMIGKRVGSSTIGRADLYCASQ